mmetsp:Transcript_49345/g.158531  ORF Transcript_49345/g.158531 Transcript_49345/m.158531 type:complete len:557 (-) Transcript_49345:215-1885(-)
MDHSAMARPALGLAGAEKRLYELNMNQGEISVQRQVMQFRVDYLSDLNTQSMLMAGVAAGMISSIELEAMRPEEDDPEFCFRTVLCFFYILAAVTSLGASIWVLYTSNNLINSALVAQLYGSTLADMQNAESVLELRMLDVRKMYILALVTMLPALLVMVLALIPWYISLPAVLVVGWFLAHAIHADFATAWHLERYNIPLSEMRPEYWVEGVAQRFFGGDGGGGGGGGPDSASRRTLGGAALGAPVESPRNPVSNFLEIRLRSIFGTSSYNRLGDRVNALDEKRMSAAIKRGVSFSGGSPFGPAAGRKTAFATQLVESELSDGEPAERCGSPDLHRDSAALIQRTWVDRLMAKTGHAKGAGASGGAELPHGGMPTTKQPGPAVVVRLEADATLGYMCKTPSDKGPSAVIHSLAIGPMGRHELLRTTPANTPSHTRWWVLRGSRLACYKSETEQADGVVPKLVVDLRSYVVVRTWDPHGLLCVALVPRHVLKPPVPTSAKTGGPGQRRPTEVRMQAERSWYLCAYPASISNSVHTETWFARLEANCGTPSNPSLPR